MVNVKVRYFTTLRELAGVPEETIHLREGAVLADLIKKIASKYGKEAREYLYSKGRIDPSIYFLINGEDSRVLSGLKTRLREGDIVAIIPPIGGG
jgi:MoaD family protein